jgi:hypothetical protein
MLLAPIWRKNNDLKPGSKVAFKIDGSLIDQAARSIALAHTSGSNCSGA